MYRKTVLVVVADDDARAGLVQALTQVGYGTFEAGNGMDALERASLDQPGLIFVDLGLDDGMDGWTTVKFLSDSPRTEAIPVVVLFMFLQKYLISGLTAGAVKG